MFCATLGCCLLAKPGVHAQGAKPYTTWSDYGGGPNASQYSALRQINRSNVSKLQIAWTYPTADGGTYLFNPLVVDGVMYVLARQDSIVALDASTGKKIWVHENPRGRIITRGINYWESADRSERRLLFSDNNFLQAIDARTGQSIASFGSSARVDPREETVRCFSCGCAVDHAYRPYSRASRGGRTCARCLHRFRIARQRDKIAACRLLARDSCQ